MSMYYTMIYIIIYLLVMQRIFKWLVKYRSQLDTPWNWSKNKNYSIVSIIIMWNWKLNTYEPFYKP